MNIKPESRNNTKNKGVSPQALRICGFSLICIMLMFGVAAINKARAPEYLLAEYTIEDDLPRHVKFESSPRDLAQQAVGFFYMYQGTAQYEKCRTVTAPSRAEEMNFEQQSADFKEGCYVKEYVIHSFRTLPEKEYEDRKEYYDGLAKSCGLKQYRVVQITFDQKWSDAALEKAPQWGDGSFTREFAVGKEKKPMGKWKIFNIF